MNRSAAAVMASTLLVAALLAGCTSNPKDGSEGTEAPLPTDTTWVNKALMSNEGDHDHRNAADHKGLSTPNFKELGHNPLAVPQFGNETAGGTYCGGATTTSEGRRITVVHSFDTNIAFMVIDITDAKNPIHLGDYYLDNAQTYDVDVTPDGKHVAIAGNVGPGQPTPGGRSSDPASWYSIPLVDVGTPVLVSPWFRNACTGEVVRGPDQQIAAGPSTILASIADPTAPVFEDVFPDPVIGPHSVSTAEIDGVTYIASSITNLVHAACYFHFYQLLDLPTGTSKLVPVSLVDSLQYGDPTALTNGHVDAEITVHPATGQPVVYLSDWDGGFVILDFSNPLLPLPLGQWADQGPSNGALHSTYSLPELHNGRHYVLAGQEFVGHPVERPSGWIYILDDTDPTDIKEVGRWTLPIDVQSDWDGVELFSTHYFRAVNDTVFVAMYHGGLWAFKMDFEHPENMRTPKSIGVFMPDQDPQGGRAPTGVYDYAPFVLDAFPYPDYTVAVYDGLSGVYTVQFDPTMPIASPDPWPLP